VSVVVDANLIVAIALPLPYSEPSRQKIKAWKGSGEATIAPPLWEYEVTSALRRAAMAGWLNSDETAEALHRIMTLNIESIPPSEALHLKALKWAERLSQTRAYDAQYIALAEEMGLEFWTADRRLVEGCKQLGAAWVHWVGE
jgi:predicted nucleic acid-binding protein